MNKCFACDKPLKGVWHLADTRDGQVVYVGSECAKRINEQGYQPPKGGPKLYPAKAKVSDYDDLGEYSPAEQEARAAIVRYVRDR